MESSMSHVASSRSWCLIYIFTCPMVRSGTPPWSHYTVVLCTDSSKSLITCISTHHQIFFRSCRILLYSLEHLQCLWKSNNTYAQVPSNESIPISDLQGFSKIMDESHAHVYRHKINKKLPSEPNTYLA